MSLSPDEFHMLHGDAVRESLMTAEGYDGTFQLLAHCRLRIDIDEQERLFAVVRSTNTQQAYALVQQPGVRQWQPVSAEDLHLVQQQLASMTEAARECARGLLAARPSTR
jgi:hypothetical protein